MLSIAPAFLAVPIATALPQDGGAPSAEAEAAFAELLTGARLVGSYTLDGETPPALHEDSYTLTRVSKVTDGSWHFEAQVEYQGTAIPISLALPVEWAGDTPMISVTKMSFPMLGEYSARVLFHENTYAGVWTGKGYGGAMFGRIERIGSGGDGAGDGEEDADEAGDEAPPKGNGSSAGTASEASDSDDTTNWPSFRGPQAAGVADGFATVVEWDVESGDNVKWRQPVPGLCHSSPVIWGDRLFVTTAVRKDGEQELRVGLYGAIDPVEGEGEFRFELHCLDKNTGEPLWHQTSWEGEPAIKRHTKGSHASSSPATDGERVVAFYGSEGLYCYDMQGELLWEKSFGVLDSGYYMVPSAQWGFSSSPVLHDGVVVVQVDVQAEDFVAALDAKTGEELWRTAREEVPTWSTPTIDVRDGRAQVICNGYKHIGGYDLKTGEELWKLEGGGDIPVPTPIVSHDKIFVTNSHGRMAPIYAIDVMASGTLTMDPDESEHMVWSNRRGGNYMQTPFVYGEEIYFCNDAGILTCYDVNTGEELFRERVGSGRTGFTGSGVAADGKIYLTSEEGDVYVVAPGFFEVLAVNSLGEECMSSPAISEGVLYFRSRHHVTAVGE